MIEAWNPEKHLPLVRQWLVDSGTTADEGPSDLYPETGFVVDDCAAAFLYLTNARGVAYLDNLVTDPKASPRRRRAAIKTLCESLVKKADDCGVRLVWCLTPVAGLEPILRESGFGLLDVGYGCFARSK